MELSMSTLLEMEKYCIARYQKKCFINNGIKISNEAFLKLKEIQKETNTVTVSDCFERLGQGDHRAVYYVDVNCCDCNKIYGLELSKARLMEYVSEKYVFQCQNCRNEKYKKQREEAAERAAEIKENITKNTQTFIELYLNPNRSWSQRIPSYKYFSLLLDELANVDCDLVASNIKTLEYKEFLSTPYWIAVSQKKKQQAGFKCELCNSKGFLNVHHKTYENHGYEAKNLKDLIVLCNNCHKKFHDIED